MNRSICLLFSLGLLALFISDTFAQCLPTACQCPSYALQGQYCGGSQGMNNCIISHIFECSPGGTDVCEYGPCTSGCCSFPQGTNDFCCSDSACAGCVSNGGTVIPPSTVVGGVGGGAVPVSGVSGGSGPTSSPIAAGGGSGVGKFRLRRWE